MQGVPTKGYRLTARKQRWIAEGKATLADFECAAREGRIFDPDRGDVSSSALPTAKVAELKAPIDEIEIDSDEDIASRISERFEVVKMMTIAALAGEIRALIVSGPAGVGKSHNIMSKINEVDPDGVMTQQIKGYAKATGLYKALYTRREKGQVTVLDDCDAIFRDETALNILKAVCDSSEKRRVSWLSEAKLFDEDGVELLPKSFDFEGTVIFITNYNFDQRLAQQDRLAPHMEALMSRALYVDLTLHSVRARYLYICRVILEDGMLNDMVTNEKQQAILGFIERNLDDLREVSLRMVMKLVGLINAPNWERMAIITCCKNDR